MLFFKWAWITFIIKRSNQYNSFGEKMECQRKKQVDFLLHQLLHIFLFSCSHVNANHSNIISRLLMGRMEITQITQFWLAWYQWIITVNKILLSEKKKQQNPQHNCYRKLPVDKKKTQNQTLAIACQIQRWSSIKNFRPTPHLIKIKEQETLRF